MCHFQKNIKKEDQNSFYLILLLLYLHILCNSICFAISPVSQPHNRLHIEGTMLDSLVLCLLCSISVKRRHPKYSTNVPFCVALSLSRSRNIFIK